MERRRPASDQIGSGRAATRTSDLPLDSPVTLPLHQGGRLFKYGTTVVVYLTIFLVSTSQI